MKYEGSRTGRFEIAQVPLFEWSEDDQRFKAIDDEQIPLFEVDEAGQLITSNDEPTLPCSHWCLICKDIQRNFEMNPSSVDSGLPCAICPDCSDTPEWTI